MKKFLQGFIHAFRGIGITLATERNFQVHFIALLTVIVAGFYFDVTSSEWMILILTSTLVMTLEAINTAIEKLCNEVTLERKESIRNIKDVAAGAVLLSSIVAITIAIIVFWKHS
jgi:diacylglycerol kinase